MRNRSWLAGLASKIFPRRFAAAKRALHRRTNSLRSFSDAPLASERLEARQMLFATAIEWDDPTVVFSAEDKSVIESHVIAAGEHWAGYLDPGTSTTLDVKIAPNHNYGSLASAGSAMWPPPVLNGYTQQGAAWEIMTGVDPNGTGFGNHDIEINIGYQGIDWFFETDPWDRTGAIPATQNDFFSTILHEWGHALGFNGGLQPYDSDFNGVNDTYVNQYWLNGWATGSFDAWLAIDSNEYYYFTGPNATATYGANVPLYSPIPPVAGSSIYHLGNPESWEPGYNLSPGGTSPDLMYYAKSPGPPPNAISAINLAIMKDIGYANVREIGFADRTLLFDENTAEDYGYPLIANDPYGNAVSISILPQFDTDGDGNMPFRMASNWLVVNDPDDLDYEASPTMLVNLRASNGVYSSDATAIINLLDLNEAPVFNDQNFSVVENSDVGTVIGSLVAADPDGDALTFAILTSVDPDGDGNAAVRIDGNQLVVNDRDDLDYETDSQIVVIAYAFDGINYSNFSILTVDLSDANEAPSGVGLVISTSSLAEGTETTSAIKLADIQVNDDALGTNAISLTGADAASFTLVGTELFLAAGTLLDYETKSSFDVTVSVEDSSVSGSTPVTANMTLSVTDTPATVAVAVTEQGDESDNSSSIFTLTRAGDTSGTLAVNLLLLGSAKAGVDYTAPAGLGVDNTLSVSFADGEATTTIDLQTLSDAVIDPLESIQAILQPGTGYSIAPAQDRGTVYLGAEGVAVELSMLDSAHSSSGVKADDGFTPGASQATNIGAFTALNTDGTVSAWGEMDWGAISNAAPAGSGFTQVVPNAYAFAGLKDDGTIECWGRSGRGGGGGGEVAAPVDSGYVALYSNEAAFAAMKSDGSLTIWGHAGHAAGQTPSNNQGFVRVVANAEDFTAIRADGTLWSSLSGAPQDGGYVQVTANKDAFTAMKADGTLVLWGESTRGDGLPVDTGYERIYSNPYASAALKTDGTIASWGYDGYGGSGAAPAGTGYTTIVPGHYAFAALNGDGTVASWGSNVYGGTGAPVDSGYVQLIGSERAFAALNEDGTVQSWGDGSYGGSGAPVDGGYVHLFSAGSAFVAMKADGSLTAWGNASKGGSGAPGDSGYVQVYGNTYAFVAVSPDGSMTAWGDGTYGGSGAPAGTGFVDFAAPKPQFLLSATNQAPTGVALSNTVTSLPEDTDTNSAVKVADIQVTDDGHAESANTISLSGTDAASFAVVGTELFLAAGTSLDYESQTSYDVTVSVEDSSVAGSTPVTVNHTLAISDVNEAPTGVALTNVVISLPEDTDTSSRVKIADIEVTDDALGSNAISLSGADLISFEVDGTELFLAAGTALDYETQASYTFTVNVEDSSVAGSTPVTVNYTLLITDANDAPVLDDANMSVAENSAEGTVVGTLAATDQDGTEATVSSSMFWVDDGSVYRADRDGSNLTQIHDGANEYFEWVETDPANDHLYLRGEDGVWRMEYDGSNLTNLVGGLQDGFGIAVDLPNNTIYYGDFGNPGVYRSDLDGSNIQLLPNTSSGSDMLRHVHDIEVVSSIDKVYYTNAEHAQFNRFRGIRRANLDGTGVEDVVDFSNNDPVAVLLAVDETNGHLYYSHEPQGTITKSDLDGSNASTFLSGLTEIYDLEVDAAEGKLYYSSSSLVGRINLDGTGQETLTTLGGNRFSKGLALSYTSVPAITYSITSNVNPDGDGNDAFRIEGDKIVVNDADDLDYESDTQLVITAQASDGSLADTATVTVAITDENEAPTGVALTNTVTSLAEDTDTTSAVKVADIQVTDDALGTNVISLSGADAASFEVVGTELQLKAGTALDYETKTSYAVTLSVEDSSVSGSTPVTVNHTLAISDVNEAPTGVAMANTVTSLPEDTDTTSAVKVADIQVTDDALGTNVISLSGADAASFEVVGTELQLKAGTALDYETKTSYAVMLSVEDSSVSGSTPVTVNHTLAISDVNEAPSGVGLVISTSSLPEDTDTTSAIKLADIQITDDGEGTNVISLSGADAVSFSVVGTELYLAAGTSLDYETQSSYDVTVSVEDSSVSGSTPVTVNMTLSVSDVNEAPTGVALANTVTSLPEDTDTTSAIKVADIQITDDALGTNVISLSGADAASFEVVGTELQLKAGTALDYETQSSYSVTVSVEDSGVSGSTPVTVNHTLAISDVNEAPSGVGLVISTSSLPEDTDTSSAVKVADVQITDDALGTNVISLSGADAASFTVVGTELFLAAGTALDYETKTSYAVMLSVEDSSVSGSTPVTVNMTLSVSDVNEAPTGVALANTVSSLPEDTDTSSAVKVADIQVTDDALGTNVISLSGADAASFTVVGTELFLAAGTALDYETKTSYAVTLSVEDSSVSGSTPVTVNMTLSVSDVNEAPTGVALANTVSSLPEDTDTTSAVKVADVQITDDALGTNVISLSGADAASFTVVGTELFLAAGTALDYETQASYDVTVSVEDSSVSGSTPVTANMTLSVTDTPATVAVAVTEQGDESDNSSSIFTLTRAGDTSGTLAVNLLLLGSAKAGVDYTAPAGLGVDNTLAVSFADGEATTTIDLQTLSDAVIDPLESIQAILQPGTGYSIAPAQDRGTVYLGAEGVAVELSMLDSAHSSSGVKADDGFTPGASQATNIGAFTALNTDGTVSAWGEMDWGASSNAAPAGSGFTQVVPNAYAFAGLKDDGTIECWGRSGRGGGGGDVAAPVDSGYVALYSNEAAFAAMKSDGSLTIWGHAGHAAGQTPSNNQGFVRVVANAEDFTAIRADGTLWSSLSGAPQDGGYTQVTANKDAFTAMKADGSLVLWGEVSRGDGLPGDTGYERLYSNPYASAALKTDGTLASWGYDGYGGSGAAPAGTGYTTIVPGHYAFAALNSSGTVTSWGSNAYGGSGAPVDSGYVQLIGSERAFAALNEDGTVQSWGDGSYGGSGAPVDGGYVHLFSAGSAFVAMKADGSLSAWGNASKGGSGAPGDTGYVNVYGNTYAFVAVSPDGSMTAWGDGTYGGSGAPAGTGFVDFAAPKPLFLLSATNQAPTGVALANTTTSLPEDTDTTSAIKLADIQVTDDALGSNAISLTGTDAASFSVVGTELYLAAGTSLDYETQTSFDVTVSVEDSSVAGSTPVTVNYSLAISDVNEAPTGVALANTTTSLPEDTDTSGAIKVADIQVTDDALGTNGISLSGTDAASFSVVGTELFLAAGISLDYETQTSYDVTVSVEDGSVAGSTPLTANYTLSVTDANDAPVLDDANMSVAENSAEGTVVGTLVATDQDGTEATVESYVFWVDDGNVYQSNRDGSGIVQIHNASNGSFAWVETDSASEHLYLRGSKDGSGGVWRMNYDGSDLTEIVSGYAGGYGIAIDPANDTLYFGSHGTGIYTAQMDGSNVQLLPNTSSGYDFLRHTHDIEVAPSLSKVYYTNGEHTQFNRFKGIRRADPDGTNVENIVDYSPNDPVSLLIAIDETNGHLYYAQDTQGTIKKSNLDGSGESTILSGFNEVYDVEVDPAEGKIYFSSSSLVGRANLDGSGYELLTTLGGNRFNKGLALSYTSVPAITYSITGNVDPDGDGNDAFRIEGDSIVVNDADDLDYESDTQLVITAEASDGSLTDTATVTIAITDENEAPTGVALANTVSSLPEDTDTSGAIKVADIQVTDDALGTNVISLSGADAASFEVVGTELFLAAGTALDYETQTSYDVTVSVEDSSVAGSTPVTVNHTLAISDANEAPTGVALANTVSSLPEDTDTSSAVKVADIQITDDALGTNVISLSGADAVSFEVVGTELQLKAGTALDYEAQSSYDVTVSVEDSSVSGSTPVTVNMTLSVSDVNEAPTGVALANTTTSLPEDTDTSGAIKVADIQITDDALGTNVISLSGADAASFEVVGTELFLAAGTALDYETQSSYDVTVSVEDSSVSGSTPVTVNMTLAISDANEAPSGVGLVISTSSLPENTDTSSAIKLADIQITDDGEGTNAISLSGTDAASFEVVGTELFLAAGTALDYETKTSYAVMLSVEDSSVSGSTPVTVNMTLSVSDVNEAPSGVGLVISTSSLPEDTDTTSAVKLADIQVTDDALGTNVISLSGTDAASFEVVGTELQLKAGMALDYETQASYDVTVSVEDSGVSGSTPVTVNYSLAISDVNEAPTGVALTNVVISLPEDTDTTSAVKVADIQITDDAIGNNAIILSGTDSVFTVVGTELFLAAGTALDYETKTSYAVTLSVEDGSVAGSTPVTVNYSLAISDVNEAPTGVALANTVTSLPEDTDTASAVKVADIDVTDDALGTNAISLTGTDAASFSVVGTELFLAAGTALDYETQASYDVTVSVEDSSVSGSTPVTVNMTLSVSDVNEAPTGVALANTTTSLPEDTDTSGAIKVADIQVTDDALGTNGISLSGTDAASFSVVGTELFLAAGTALDYETQASYDVTVEVVDNGLGGSPVTANMTLSVSDVNEAPTGVALANTVTSLPENTDTSSAIKLADIQVTDDALGTNVISLSGADAASFTVVGTELFLVAGTALDYETQASYDVTVSVEDSSVSGSTPVTVNMTLSVSDVNEAPTGVALANTVTSLPEDTDTTSAVKVADIQITDDGEGTNAISLSGTDAASFEVVGTELFLAAGTALDYETKTSYAVTLSVEDSSVAGSVPVTVNYSLAISDANEAPTGVALANTVSSLPEDTDTTSAIKLADIQVNDDALGSNVISLTGADAASFEVVGTELYLAAGVVLDYETQTSYDVTVSVEDSSVAGSTPVTVNLTLAITDENEAPTGVALANTVSSLPEDTDTVSAVKVADVQITDDALGSNAISLSGTDAASFTVVGTELFLAAGTALDYETQASYDVTVSVEDSSVSGSTPVTVNLTLAITDENEAPTGVALANTVSSLPEDTDTVSAVKVADVQITDDALGSNAISLSGTDAASFTVVGTELFLAAGTALDYETQASYDVTVSVEDSSVSGSTPVTVNYSLAISDVNEAPTGVALTNVVISLPEDTDTTSPVKIADIDVTDDALGTNAISLTGTDAASFTVVGTELFLAAGTALDYETQSSYDVTVSVEDGSVSGSTPVTVNYSLAISDVNEAPTGVALANTVTSLPEDTDTSSAVKVADIQVTDDALGTNAISLSGADAASFEVVGTELFLAAGTALDYETQASYDVTVSVEDSSVSGSTPVTVNYSLAISDVNEAPTGVALANTVTSLPEDTDTSSAVKVADIQVTDDALGTNVISLSGADANDFDVVGTELYLVAGTALDYETQASYDVTVSVEDSSVSGSTPVTVNMTLSVSDVNEAPTGVALANTVTSLPEDTDTSSAIKLADIQVTDDALGTNVISLSGADANDFDVVGTELYLVAGTALDYETQASYDVTVSVEDSSVSGSTPVTVNYSLAISDVNEAPTGVALANTVTSLPEDTDTTSAVKLADIQVTDDALGTNVISLSGADAASFTVVGTELFLVAGTALDYETQASYEVTVSVEDSSVSGSTPVTVNYSLAISDVNEAPTGVALANTVTSLPEDTDTTSAVKVADIQVTDDALGTNVISLSGTDAASFTVVGTELFLVAGTALDYETQASYDVTVSVEDSGVSGSTPVTVNYSLAISDVNEAPSGVGLVISTSSLPEDTDTTSAIKLADIQVTDDALGTNVISLSGADANDFDVVGTELFLAAGTALDYETQASYDVTVSVEDSSVSGSTPVTVNYSLAISDVNDSVLSGTVFEDINSDGTRDAEDIGLAGWTVYLDTNNDGVLDGGEVTTTTLADDPATAETNEAGSYSFTGLTTSQYTVRIVVQSDWVVTSPAIAEFTSGDSVGVNALISADFNDDGVNDLAGTAGVVLSDGQGGFGDATALGISLIYLAAGDIDNDGDIDLAAANMNDLAVLLNDGQGTFASPVFYSVFGHGGKLAIADVNDDGNLDIAVVDYGPAELVVMLGDGTGAFGTPSDYASGGSEPDYLVMGDYDLDGDIDAVVQNHNGGGSSDIAFLANDGNGVFSHVSSYSVDATYVQYLEQADIDGDGDLDILASATTSNTIRIFENDGSGGFGTTTTYGDLRYAKFGDMDNDGDQDILAQSSAGLGFMLFTNDGYGNFSSPVSVVAANNSARFVIDDLDGDGRVDLTVEGSVYLNQIDQTPSQTATASASGLDFGVMQPVVNEAPTDVALSNTVSSLPEDTDTSSRVKIADIDVTDDGLGTNAISLSGADLISFEVDGTELFLVAGTALDYETQASYDVTVSVEDSSVSGSTPVTVNYSLAISDVNEAPTGVALTNVVISLPEDTDTTSAVKLADIQVTDDALGNNAIILSGTDAVFTVVGTELFLAAGTALDYETQSSYDVTVSVEDGSVAGSTPVTVNYTLLITNVNDAPEFSYPGPQSVAEDTDLVFSAAGGNPLGLSDEDAGDAEVGMRIDANYGLLTLPDTTGLTFLFGSINGSHSLSVLGTIADINTALDGLIYSPLADYHGADTLSLTAHDLGHSGPGGNQMSVATVEIAINPVNDAPQLTIPADQTTPFNTTLFFSAANDNAIQAEDVDAGTAEIGMLLSLTSGTFSLAQTTGLTIFSGSDNSSLIMCTGTLANINAALEGLGYTPSLDVAGDATLTILLNDLGNSGSGNDLSDTKTVVITAETGTYVPVTIIDSSEGAPGFVPSSSSGWITQSSKPLAYLENTHKLKIINQVSGTQAEWVFSDLPNGQYKVATTWWSTPSRATAPYTIGWGDFGNSSGGVLATKECDQTQAPDDFTDGDGWTWEELGTVNVEHGELKVRLEDGIGPWYKNLIADAVRIEKLGSVTPTLTVAIVADSVSEAAGAAATTATVTRTDTSGDLVVTLASDDTSEATVPSSVTILDGQSSASFEIAAIDDSAADGTQTVTFSATATGYTAGSDTLEVTDDEVSAVTIIDSSEGAPGFIPSSSSGWTTQSSKPLAYLENTHKLKIINQVSGTQAEWVFSDLPNGQYKVATTWWYTPSRATAPYTIGWGDFGNSSGGVLATKECDQTQAPDDFTDGDGWTWEELGTVNVEHGELKVRLEDGIGPWYKNLIADAVRIEKLGSITPTLTVAIAADSVSEAAGTAATTATVTRTDTSGDLVVSLASDDTSEATVPLSVTILDGQSSASFEIAAIDDSAADGTQTVTFSATATGYTAGSDTLEVTDDEVSAVTIIDSSEGAPGFVPSSSSGWITQSSKPLAYLENTHKLKIINQVSGTQAEWSFTDLPNGQYKVATTWWHTPSRATAPYTIGWGDFGNSSGGVLATKECDQTQAPDDFTDGDGWTWEELGTVNVEHGELKVRLEDGIGHESKNLIADAVRIEKLGSVIPALTVAIAADSVSEAAGTAATTVTILDGQSSASFNIAAIDDSAADGTQTVTFSATATGYAAGSDTLEVTDDESALVTIVDNGASGFTQTGFSYQDNSQVAAAYEGDNHTMWNGTGEATWSFSGLENGEYQVTATWAHKYGNRYNAPAAPFAIQDGSGAVLASVTVDQRNSPSQFAYQGYYWDTLGTVSVSDGALVVTLGADAQSNTYSVADAVRIERLLPSARAAEASATQRVSFTTELGGSFGGNTTLSKSDEEFVGTQILASGPANLTPARAAYDTGTRELADRVAQAADAALIEDPLEEVFDELAGDWQQTLAGDDADPFAGL